MLDTSNVDRTRYALTFFAATSTIYPYDLHLGQCCLKYHPNSKFQLTHLTEPRLHSQSLLQRLHHT